MVRESKQINLAETWSLPKCRQQMNQMLLLSPHTSLNFSLQHGYLLAPAKHTCLRDGDFMKLKKSFIIWKTNTLQKDQGEIFIFRQIRGAKGLTTTSYSFLEKIQDIKKRMMRGERMRNAIQVKTTVRSKLTLQNKSKAQGWCQGNSSRMDVNTFCSFMGHWNQATVVSPNSIL